MRGRGDIADNIRSLDHPAALTLDRIRRNGVPVVLKSSPWPDTKLTACFARGAHRSAYDHVPFLQEEFLDFCRKGYWMLLPFHEVKSLPGLRLSPLGVVPQRERRPRIIVDYSYWGINADTLRLSNPHSMQFGHAQRRIHQRLMWANPRYGAIHAYKLDIADGFYRIPLSTSGIPKLGVLLPPILNGVSLVAFPLVLPMGWTESPPFFCKFTETACDLANRDMRHNHRWPPHPLEPLAGKADFRANPDCGFDNHPLRPTPLSHIPLLAHRPLAMIDVFVDDFLGFGQHTPHNPLPNQRRTILHRIDQVFRPNDLRDHSVRKDPISLSKLIKEDAAFQDVKRILGWDLGLRSKTMRRAPHRELRALDSINNAQHRTRVGQTQWQSLLGQLRSLADGLPGALGQFSLLQAALQAGQKGRIRVRAETNAQLDTFANLLQDPRPTPLDMLVPGIPVHFGACDASKAGMGGVWFPNKGPPLLWRMAFPVDIQRRLVSTNNPNGLISNSDLELAGTIMHQAVLAAHVSVEGETIHTHCDNTAAVAWRHKGSTTTTKADRNSYSHYVYTYRS